MRTSSREDYEDSRADDFRCYGCEKNIGRGGYCEDCRPEGQDEGGEEG